MIESLTGIARTRSGKLLDQSEKLLGLNGEADGDKKILDTSNWLNRKINELDQQGKDLLAAHIRLDNTQTKIEGKIDLLFTRVEEMRGADKELRAAESIAESRRKDLYKGFVLAILGGGIAEFFRFLLIKGGF